MRTIGATALLCACMLTSLVHGTEARAQAVPDPAKVVTLADVQAVLGGKFAARVVEPGVVAYEETGGPRVVEISIAPAGNKTVEAVKADRVGDGEPVDDLKGLGDAAMYRPQGNLATVQKRSKAGTVLWFEVRVHNVEGPGKVADTKRFATELAKRGAARLS